MNSALLTDGFPERYSAQELEAFKNNSFPEAYANVDWYNEAYADVGFNHQFKFDVKGGKEKFDYYALIGYSRNEGLFKHYNQDERYANRLLDTRLTLRTNVTVDVTSTTTFTANLQAQLKEFNGPTALSEIINSVYKTPSGAFPIRSNNNWGGNAVYSDKNPLALLSSNGHYKTMINSLNPRFWTWSKSGYSN